MAQPVDVDRVVVQLGDTQCTLTVDQVYKLHADLSLLFQAEAKHIQSSYYSNRSPHHALLGEARLKWTWNGGLQYADITRVAKFEEDSKTLIMEVL